jgi:hypothetical protein
MKTYVGLGLAVVAACLFVPAAQAGGHGCSCCNGTVAPAAASPAAAAYAPAVGNQVAQNANQGYRAFSYQPGATMNTGNAYYPSSSARSYQGRGYQPMWMNGANKSLGRYN